MPAVMNRIFFVDSKGVWCETYYSISPSLGDAMRVLKIIAVQRSQIIASDVSIGSVRVCYDPPNGDALVDGVRPNSSEGQTSQNNDAVNVRFEAVPVVGGPVYHRSSSMRGLPAQLTQGSGGHPALFNSRLSDLLLAWLNLLRQYQYCLKCQSKSTPWVNLAGLSAYGYQDCDAWGNPLALGVPEGSGYLLATPSSPLTIPAFDANTGEVSKIQIRRFQATRNGQPATYLGVDGIHTLVNMLAGSLIFSGTIPEDVTTESPGQVRPVQTVYVPIQTFQLMGTSTRKTGARSSYGQILPDSSTFQRPLPAQAPPVAPGPAGPPTPGVNPPPAVNTYANAQDIAVEIFLGYKPNPQGTIFPLGIAQASNFPNTWAMFISGTNLTFNATGIPEDIAAAFNQPDLFSDWIVYWTKSNVPQGASLLITGHSLGGMEGQNVTYRLQNAGYRPTWVTCYGSPVTVAVTPPIYLRMWMLVGDTVTNVTPQGYQYGLRGHPEQTKLNDPAIPHDVVSAHLGYPKSTLLQAYTPFGYSFDVVPDLTLQTGAVKRLPIPLVPPPAELGLDPQNLLQ
jgi:hypothetical protein